MPAHNSPFRWTLAVAMLGVFAHGGDASAQGALPPPSVSVAPAITHQVTETATFVGRVTAVDKVDIVARVPGFIEERYFTEGQQVKKGDVLAKIDPRLFQAALDQAKAKKAQDIAQFISASKDLERSNTLVKSNITSQQIVDQQQGKVDQLRAMIDADEAMIQTAQTNLDYTTITAPNDGRMGVRLVDPGNIVHANDQGSIATLVLTRPSAVLFTLPARALDDVRAAMARGPVEVIAFDQDNRHTLATGTLLLVDNTIDQTTATIRLKAMFPNEDDKLWPGEFVNARVLLETRSNAVVVPSAAVQRGPNGLFVWAVSGKDIAEPHPIETAQTYDNLTIVTSGLSGGERVVTDGQYRLQRNAPVTFTSPQVAGSAGNS